MYSATCQTKYTLPAHSELLKVDFPAPHVLLLSLNRPKALNAMSLAMQQDLKAILDWFEDEPELWFVNITKLNWAFQPWRYVGLVYAFC